jgi:hypothetical protein
MTKKRMFFWALLISASIFSLFTGFRVGVSTSQAQPYCAPIYIRNNACLAGATATNAVNGADGRTLVLCIGN